MKNSNSLLVLLTAGIGVLAIAAFIGFLLSYPLMLLWNGCLVPATNILNEVTWMQMWGISFLTSSLFKPHSIGSK